jgi:hypothetical protein
MTRCSAHVVLVSALIWSGCTSNATDRAEDAAEPAVEAATVKELMLQKVIPLSNVVFQAAAEPPKSNDEWDRIRTSATELAQSARELQRDMMSPHARDTEWIEASRILAESARQAAQAAESRDVDGVIAAGDRAFVSCEQCHGKYLPVPSQ